MSIQIFNGVRNTLGTPAIITDTFANRPTASTQSEGTLFYCSDTPDIYQVISGNWKVCGGGGGSQSFQDTLIVSSSLNQINVIGVYDILNFDTNTFTSEVTFGLDIKTGYTTFTQKNSGGGNLDIITYHYDNGSFQLIPNYFAVDITNSTYYLGDFQQVNNGTYLYVDDGIVKRISLFARNMVYFESNDFNINEFSTGNGKISINGTGYVSVTGGSTNAGHLKIDINGVTHYIALKT